ADQKLAWLGARERQRGWPTVIVPGLRRVWPASTDEQIADHFLPIWDRLNRVVHPSAELVLSGFNESSRYVFNHFDGELAGQLLADAGEVFAVISCLVIDRFPKVIPRLTGQPWLFRHCPQARV